MILTHSKVVESNRLELQTEDDTGTAVRESALGLQRTSYCI